MTKPLQVYFRKCIISWNGDDLKFWQAWITKKEVYHEPDGRRRMFWELTPLRIAFTELGLRSKCQSWFGQKCALLPDKDWFHFVYAKCGSRLRDWCLPFCHSGSDHCNPPPLFRTTKPIQIWSVLPEITLQKIRIWGSGFSKSLSSLLKTWLELYIVW